LVENGWMELLRTTDKPVVIVVHSVRFFVKTVSVFPALPGVVPDVGLDVRMVITETVVQQRHHYTLAASRDSPCFLNIQIDAFLGIEFFDRRFMRTSIDSNFAARIVKAELILIVRIVRSLFPEREAKMIHRKAEGQLPQKGTVP
jgi:hypothetical protein